jgi:hypothetical protein
MRRFLLCHCCWLKAIFDSIGASSKVGEKQEKWYNEVLDEPHQL